MPGICMEECTGAAAMREQDAQAIFRSHRDYEPVLG